MTKPRPYASPSTPTGTHLNPRTPTVKQTHVVKRAQWKNSATYSYVWDKARAIQASLDPKYPSFIKILYSSYAAGGILSLPVDFRRNYANNDGVITLVGEDGMRSPVVYVPNLGIRGGGWKDFCASYNLQVGDALVCHLISKDELKVYIVRVNDLDLHAQEENSEIEERDGEDVKYEEESELGGSGIIFNSGNNNCSYVDREDAIAENITVEHSSQEPFVDLKSFKIIVNGYPLDSELSVSVRVKYYELCLARKSYLHSGLLKRINHQLVTGMILETVSIVDAIKACCLSTSPSDIKEWERNLEGFRLLGMDVDFLLDRVKELLQLAEEYHETTKKEKHLEEEIASLETKMMELKEAKTILQSEKEVLDVHLLKQRLSFQETAKKPW